MVSAEHAAAAPAHDTTAAEHRLHRLRTWATRLAGFLGLFLLGALLAAPWAVTSAHTHQSFGPHEAEYSVTTDAAITVDLGPLGSLVVPAGGKLPLGLGVHVRVEEIPANAGLAASTIDGLGQDATAYASLFGDPDALITVVRDGLIADALTRDLTAAAVFACIASAWLLARGARAGRSRRQREAAAAAGVRLPAPDPADGPSSMIAAALVVMLVALATVPISRPADITPNPIFARTPLEGSEVTGRFADVIDDIATVVTDYYTDNEQFYDTARDSLDAAWVSRAPSVRTASGADIVPRPDWPQPSPATETSPGQETSPAQETAGQAAQTGPAASADHAQAGGQPAPGALPSEDPAITVLYASDIHCNTGMSRVLARAAVLSGAELYLDGGDITMTGTSAENICIDSLDQALPAGLPRLYVKGNHDSADSAAHAAARGWQVLDGRPVSAAGLTFFGLPDPRRTVFPTGDVLERGESAAEFTARVTAEACAADFDTLVIHDPRQAAPALGAGCADTALSGHWHRRVGPEPYGQGRRYVSSTTGGALANALTPGPLKMPAEFSLIRYDPQTRRPIDIQVITVGMDAAVSIGPWTPLPQPGPWAPPEQ